MSLIPATPGQVLEYHADLTAQHKNPNRNLVGYTHNFMTDVCRKDPSEMSGLFYPVLSDNIREVTHKHADRMARQLGRDLEDAVTYQVTAEMTDAMRQVQQESDETEALQQAELPGESGFAWFDKSWPIHDTHGDIYELRGLSWRYLMANTAPGKDSRFGDATNWPCARICLWVHTRDDPPDMQKRHSGLIGRLQLIHTAVIPFGMEFRVPRTVMPDADSFLHVTHILWMFLGMEITAMSHPKIKNYHRKHALKSLKHGEVHVVTLRRVRYITEQEGHHEVDWTCRWVVQGHYRHHSNPNAVPGNAVHHAVALHQDNDVICAVCGGQLHWVRPYLKGPDGLPLKVSHTLMKLAR